MTSSSSFSTSSAKSGNPDAIAALVNRSLAGQGITSTALTQDQLLSVYVTTTKEVEPENLLNFIEKGLCKLQPHGLKEANIFIQDSKSSKVLASRQFLIQPLTIESEDSKIIHISPKNKQSSEKEADTNKPKHKSKRLSTTKILLITALSLVGLGAVSTAGSLLWIRNSQAFVIAEALEGITSSSEGKSDLELMVDDRQSRLAAMPELESIAQFPGSRYSQAQDEIAIIEADLNSLSEQINTQSIQQQESAQQLADEVSTLLQKTPVASDDLKASREKLEEAVSLVATIPQEAEVYSEAQTDLESYQGQLSQLDETLAIEDQATEDYNSALNLAVEASNLTQGSPHAADIWQQAVTKWQESVNHLKAIPSGTSVSGNAQTKLSAYQSNLTAIQGRLNAEQKAVQDFDRAKTLASEAVNLTQNPPHSSTIWQESAQKWQQAINLLKGVPNGTTVYQDASGRISPYQDNLATVNANLKKQLEAEAFERLRPQIQSVVNQFSALDSRLDVGMNYSRYAEEVRELKVALDQLGRQAGARDLAVYQSLESAFKHYDVAKSVWQYYLESDETHSFFRASSPYGSLLMYTYGVPTQSILGTPYIYLDTAISKVWGYAHSQVTNAQNQI